MSDLALTAERRARESQTPGAEVRGPISKTIGGPAGDARRQLERPPGAGLTRRERRVKEILLKELEKLKAAEGGGGLSYVENQKLKKSLDVTFIDAELAKMRRQLRLTPLLVGALVAVVFIGAAATLATEIAQGGATWGDLFFALALAPAIATPYLQQKALKRKIWIYEALRELSDAEDLDIQLPDSVALADLLIDRLVDAEDEASRTPLRRIRT